MREIKFRGWNKQSKIMVDNIRCFAPKDTFNLNDAFDPGMIILPLQFTGLKDKNGKDIYVGDIVSVHSSVWDNDVKNKVRLVSDIQQDYAWLASSVLTTEIIGNIYENPELLEAKA